MVRPGADPRVALAEVLGVAAEDVQMREAVGSGSPARAGTVLKVRASLTDNPNPSPNMEPVEHSTGEPGSPSGNN